MLTPEDQVELALETALRRGDTSVERLRAVLRSCGARREGASVLRAVLDRRPDGAAATESWLETRKVQVLRNAGYPDPERQVRIDDERGVLIGRVDLLLGRIVIECDGREFHDDFEADRARWAALHAAGYLVMPVSFRRLEFETTALLRSLDDLIRRSGDTMP